MRVSGFDLVAADIACLMTILLFVMHRMMQIVTEYQEGKINARQFRYKRKQLFVMSSLMMVALGATVLMVYYSLYLPESP